ncbi:MAG: hypothetical protein WKF91_21125 [Segetibacter sp.]
MKKLIGLLFLATSLSCIAQHQVTIPVVSTFVTGGGGTTYDTDAQAFFTAAAITDNTQKSAVNQLVLDLKSNNLWAKMQAIYPFVGGTASSNKWNLKDPRDLDAAFRITWTGTITHDANGWQGGDVNALGYGDTHFIPSANYTSIDNSHFSIYIRTNSSTTRRDFGVVVTSGSLLSVIDLWSRYTDNTAYADFVSNSIFPNMISTDSATSLGQYLLTRTSSSLLTYYKNAASIATAGASTSTNGVPNISFFIGGCNTDGTSGLSTLRQYAFTSIGTGLTSTEAANLYTIVQAFQTTLSRQV